MPLKKLLVLAKQRINFYKVYILFYKIFTLNRVLTDLSSHFCLFVSLTFSKKVSLTFSKENVSETKYEGLLFFTMEKTQHLHFTGSNVMFFYKVKKTKQIFISQKSKFYF